MMLPRRALVVDDDPGVADAVKYRLQRCGFSSEHITIVGSALDAMLALEATRFDVVLLDQRLPDSAQDMNPRDEIGRKVLRHCRRKHPSVPVIVMTAYTGASPAEASHMTALFMKLGARDFIPKPFEDAVETLEAKILEVLSEPDVDSAAPASPLPPAPATVTPARGRAVLGIPGQEVKRRTHITVNGRDADLSNALFLMLLTLVEARLRGVRHVSNYDLGAKPGVEFRAPSALRNELKPYLDGAQPLANDGQSSYELHEDIVIGDIDCAALAQHTEARVQKLAASIAALLAAGRGTTPRLARDSEARMASSVRLRFAYQYEDRKCGVHIDGHELDLSPTHYEILAHLALARVAGGPGLVDREILGAKDYGWNEMSRLRTALRRVLGPAADQLIVPDGKRRFRLSLEPHEIEIDPAALAAHPCGRIREAFAAG